MSLSPGALAFPSLAPVTFPLMVLLWVLSMRTEPRLPPGHLKFLEPCLAHSGDSVNAEGVSHVTVHTTITHGRMDGNPHPKM